MSDSNYIGVAPDSLAALIGKPNGVASLDAGSKLTITQLPGVSFSNVLAADVPLNNAANYFDGPSVALGVGVWLVIGTVTFTDSSVASPNLNAKLWDGTTQLAAAAASTGVATTITSISLSGVIVNPVGNVRMSVKSSSVSSKIIGTICNIVAVRIG